MDTDHNKQSENTTSWETERLGIVGAFIRSEREALRLTHAELSRRAGGSPTSGAISRIENNIGNAKRHTLLKLFSALGYGPDLLDSFFEVPTGPVLQGVIRILYGIHVDKSIPTKLPNEHGVVCDVPLRKWIADNWRDPEFSKLPLDDDSYDKVWKALEDAHYVEANGDSDFIYASPSEEELSTMAFLFHANLVYFIQLLYTDANETIRLQSAAYLRRIAQRFEGCWLSPELSKQAIKHYLCYLARGVPMYASVLFQFLFLWERALDAEACKAFGGAPGSEAVGRDLLLYLARVKCIHFVLNEYANLVASPGFIEEMPERLNSIQEKHDEYVQQLSQPGDLGDVLRRFDPEFRPSLHIEVAPDGSATPLLEQARQATPALRSIPNDFLIVTEVGAHRKYLQHGITLDSDDLLGSNITIGAENDELFGFFVDCEPPVEPLHYPHVEAGEPCDNPEESIDDADPRGST